MKREITNICIIDDDRIYQSLTKKMLLKINADVEINQFRNGLEAFEFFTAELEKNNKLPQIILLDINMPTMDGWEFLEEIENLKINLNEIDIYVVSSSIAIQDVEKAKSNPHIISYITKPIKPELLSKLVL